MDRYDKTIYDPQEGIIVKQDRTLDRIRWSLILVGRFLSIITLLTLSIQIMQFISGRGPVH
jgi:hypothetical protein